METTTLAHRDAVGWEPSTASGADSHDPRYDFRSTPNSGHFRQRADLALSNVGLWSNSGRNPGPPELPLLAKSGHWYAGEKSENFHERAMRALVHFRTTGRVCPECRLIDAIVLRPTHSEIKTRTPSRNPAPPCTLVDDLARLRHYQPPRRTSHGKSRFKSLRLTIVARKPLPFWTGKSASYSIASRDPADLHKYSIQGGV